MNNYNTTQISVSDRLLAATLAAFSMFILGYTITRVYLSQVNTDSQANPSTSTVIPHQATLWSELGR